MTLIPEPIPHTYSPSARVNIRFKHFVADVLCDIKLAMQEDTVLDIVGFIAHMMRFERSNRVYLTTDSFEFGQFQALVNLKHRLAQITPITLEFSLVYWNGDGCDDFVELHIFATTDDETYLTSFTFANALAIGC